MKIPVICMDLENKGERVGEKTHCCWDILPGNIIKVWCVLYGKTKIIISFAIADTIAQIEINYLLKDLNFKQTFRNLVSFFHIDAIGTLVFATAPVQ